MGGPARRDSSTLLARVERAVRLCAGWSRSGRHRKVLAEVERILPLAANQPLLEAGLLVWKAQALLSMGCADRAQAAASRSWELDPSPHACYLMAGALSAGGAVDEAEETLRTGRELFPEAAHLALQLAMMLADQGRVPEALKILEGIPSSDSLPQDLRVFLLGLWANLLAAVGRWRDADSLLRQGLDEHPDSSLLQETHESLSRAWHRSRTEKELVASWTRSLGALSGVAAEVDEAIVRVGSVNELPEVHILAARRLWRTFAAADLARPGVPDAWAAALVVAVARLDGDTLSAAAVARTVGARPATTQKALRRVLAYVEKLDLEIARRSFAARTNPRLDGPLERHRPPPSGGDLVEFPTPGCNDES